ncbi:MAG: type I-MYXAN CRISPR-associated Cas8a1/Cmx1 [Elainellaceae cyanobacterium]
MTTHTLSIFDPNTLLPHRAGIAGLALALSALDPKDAPLSWSVTDEAVSLSWECSDREVVQWLLGQTYQVKDGYLKVPCLSLDDQGRYIFTAGVLTTFLQHSKQRSQQKETVPLSFTVDEGQPEVHIKHRPLEGCYYTGDFKEAFSSKGAFKSAIPLKGQHVPGLVECFVTGAYKESPKGYLALLFLPLACGYYQLPGYRSAVVIPEVADLPKWVKQRRFYPGRTYRKFRSSGAGESALRFLLQETLLDDAETFRVDYCEAYQLGKQPWDGNQSYLKQAVYRVKATDEMLALYQSAFDFFPMRVRQKADGESWLALSKVLPWIADNLIAEKAWYAGFYEFRKANDLYERKGLVKMAQYLNDDEKTLFDAVQGSFSTFLRRQILQAQKQGRPLDYGQVTNKVIYSLQRPSTQQEFASSLVDFFSRNPSKALKFSGPQIYAWLHRDGNWRQARDLVLLAVVTYGKAEQDAEKTAEAGEAPVAIGEATESEAFEMDLA